LGRGTAQGVDAFIIVVEPGQRSFQTAEAVRRLAKDLGVGQCYVVGSKTHNDADRQFIIDHLPGFEVLGFVNYNPKIAEADRLGVGVFELAKETVEEVKKIKENLEASISKKAKEGKY
jgi:CO dehydrogenase maturation factor